MLSKLAFSCRHAKQSVWVLTQEYNSALKGLRKHRRWGALLHCKDQDSFEDCLHENDMIPCHAEPSVWIHKQKYNSALKDSREPTRWGDLFRCKDQNIFVDCLRENDVILTREEQA